MSRDRAPVRYPRKGRGTAPGASGRCPPGALQRRIRGLLAYSGPVARGKDLRHRRLPLPHASHVGCRCRSRRCLVGVGGVHGPLRRLLASRPAGLPGRRPRPLSRRRRPFRSLYTPRTTCRSPIRRSPCSSSAPSRSDRWGSSNRSGGWRTRPRWCSRCSSFCARIPAPRRPSAGPIVGRSISRRSRAPLAARRRAPGGVARPSPSEPVRSNMDYGQINLVLMLLVVADLTGRQPWRRGLLIGLAAAVKLTPLVYLAVLPRAPRLAFGGRRPRCVHRRHRCQLGRPAFRLAALLGTRGDRRRTHRAGRFGQQASRAERSLAPTAFPRRRPVLEWSGSILVAVTVSAGIYCARCAAPPYRVDLGVGPGVGDRRVSW